METIKKYRKFIQEHNLKVWNIVTNEIFPKIKEILESYDDEIESSRIELVDHDGKLCSEYGRVGENMDIEDTCIRVTFCISIDVEDVEFERIRKTIEKRISSEFSDDLSLYSHEITDDETCEVIYDII
jgi:hypothetical protein